MKKQISLIVALVMIFSLALPVSAADNAKTSFAAPYDDIVAVALNAPAFYPDTEDWESIVITKETPLYNLEGSLTSYCFDLQNADTEENAYIIVNADPSGYPILQFAPTAVSPYYDNTDDTALYFGAGQYYLDDGEVYENQATGETYDKDEVQEAMETAPAQPPHTYSIAVAEDHSGAWQTYIEGYDALGVTPLRAGYTKLLSNRLSLQWRKGCAPTAVAMQLFADIRYMPYSSSFIIDILADYMSTSNSGSTSCVNMVFGTIDFVDEYITHYFTTEWYTQTTDRNPLMGEYYNPDYAFIDEIEADRAVTVYTAGGTYTTPRYPNGFEVHCITGVGYTMTPSGGGLEFQIAAYTTSLSDGLVYIPPYTLGDYAWFIVNF